MFPLSNTDLSFYFNQPIIVASQPKQCAQDCRWKPLLESVRNANLQFRVENIPDRSRDEIRGPAEDGLPPWPRPNYKIIIEKSSELIQLSNTNDIRILDELLRLLNYRDRAWAAHILLSRMMGLTPVHAELYVLDNQVDLSTYNFTSVSPEKWWETEGKTLHAKKAWITYIRKVKFATKWRTVELNDGQKYSYFKTYESAFK
jgi:hypothetical protein